MPSPANFGSLSRELFPRNLRCGCVITMPGVIKRLHPKFLTAPFKYGLHVRGQFFNRFVRHVAFPPVF
jgi:hypothetical protein